MCSLDITAVKNNELDSVCVQAINRLITAHKLGINGDLAVLSQAIY